MAKTEEKLPADASEKLKALEAARLQIEKQFGSGSLMKLDLKKNNSCSSPEENYENRMQLCLEKDSQTYHIDSQRL